MTNEQKLALAIVGVAVGATGVALVCRRRKTNALSGGATPPGVDERLGVLQDAVYGAIRNPQFRELALAITGNRVFDVTVGRHRFAVQGARCPERDGEAESAAVGAWVAKNRHVARELVPAGQDSAAALACALLSLNGVTCRFRAAARPGEEARVYPLAGTPKNTPSRWIPLDVNDAAYRFGLEAPHGFMKDFDG